MQTKGQDASPLQALPKVWTCCREAA